MLRDIPRSTASSNGRLDADADTATKAHFEPALTCDEAAQLLKIHPKTLQRMARKGQIPAHRMGTFGGFELRSSTPGSGPEC